MLVSLAKLARSSHVNIQVIIQASSRRIVMNHKLFFWFFLINHTNRSMCGSVFSFVVLERIEVTRSLYLFYIKGARQCGVWPPHFSICPFTLPFFSFSFFFFSPPENPIWWESDMNPCLSTSDLPVERSKKQTGFPCGEVLVLVSRVQTSTSFLPCGFAQDKCALRLAGMCKRP